MIIFFGISLMASHMLADCYYVEGIEHGRYHHAVSHILDSRNALAVSILQNVQLVLVAIAYTITGASTVVHIAQLACSYAGKTPEEIDSTGICLGGSTGGGCRQSYSRLVFNNFKNPFSIIFVAFQGDVHNDHR